MGYHDFSSFQSGRKNCTAKTVLQGTEKLGLCPQIRAIKLTPAVHFHKHQFSSVKISRSVVSDSLWPHESQHTRPPYPSPTPGVPSDSRPLSQWCHTAISSSVIPLSSCPNPSQHQSLFQWVNTSHEVAKVLEFQL